MAWLFSFFGTRHAWEQLPWVLTENAGCDCHVFLLNALSALATCSAGASHESAMQGGSGGKREGEKANEGEEFGGVWGREGGIVTVCGIVPAAFRKLEQKPYEVQMKKLPLPNPSGPPSPLAHE